MNVTSAALSLISGEARSLMSRLDNIMPYALHMTRVGAASATHEAERAIQTHIDGEIEKLRSLLLRFLGEMDGQPTPAAAQRRLSFLKLRFNVVLSHYDIYSDVLVQRSEQEHGVQLGGLDELAHDAMRIPGYRGEVPPVLCYLDRGQGAAIRRARTRLPGGGDNPVALIRVPRERMVGSGIGSSLVHEVGHQTAALLDLVLPLRSKLKQRSRGTYGNPWTYFERWISEIVADYWSVLKLGVSSTMGLIGVVSLPAAFVFRIGLDGPHPFPWLRVQLSCALGQALYRDSQWPLLAEAWGQLYPLSSQSEEQQRLIRKLLEEMPAFLDLLLGHRPGSLQGKALSDLVEPELAPAALRRMNPHVRWNATGNLPAPTRLVAAVGQARFEGRMSASKEAAILRELLVNWALRRSNNPPGGSPLPPAQPTLRPISKAQLQSTGAYS